MEPAGAMEPAGQDTPAELTPAQTAVLILGYLSTFYVLLAPLKTIRAIKAAGAVGQETATMYLCVLCNSLVWLLYGVGADDKAIMGINGIGVLFQAYFLYVFIRASTDRFKQCSYVAMVLAASASVAIYVYVFPFIPDPKDRKKAFGQAGIFSGLAMYCGSWGRFRTVWRKGNVVRDLDLNVVVSSLLNGICWSIYAMLIDDDLLLTPNAVGIGLAEFQLGVYAWYYYMGSNDNNGDGGDDNINLLRDDDDEEEDDDHNNRRDDEEDDGDNNNRHDGGDDDNEEELLAPGRQATYRIQTIE
ncbi:bidirectional sugar transporter SWEET4 [Brachypodium distachyon]|uniref:Bidirectional sugar transporter SWEET n=1 Tax=Brachypodium distachyon TaxID=15368 RepID=A0A2K2D9N4_BRADI|nr:bidirectional sugar transporter SWEET4 [Brachypodium distachyon]PNT70985.1 hypothetical protein BRADI_2g20931v3 [Brachypodium distachyon]|eukprot:XP_010233178.1 bidirectional sugar transporter SWEET4 [Brachypodium distachyon]